MVYREIKSRNMNKYYYRVISVRKINKITKKRIYLGKNLSKKELSKKEEKADKKFERFYRNKPIIKEIKSKIIEIIKNHNIKKAGIFGSYARGEQRKDSDIDILIEPSKNMGFAFAGLENELSRKLNKKVDLISYKGINPQLRRRVLNQEVKIL